MRVVAIAIVSCVGLLSAVDSARAQTFWSSTNTVDDNWSDPTAWTNNLGSTAAPIAGGSNDYTISFDGTNATFNSTNDLGTVANNGFVLNRLVRSAGAASSFLFGANLVFANSSSGVLPQVVGLTANNGTLDNNGVVLNTNLTFTGTGAGSLTITGLVSGAGGLIVNGSYTVVLRNSTNTYAGNTVINSGALQSGINAQSVDPLPFGPGKGNVIVNSGGTLFINNVNTSINGLSGGGIVDRNSAAGNTRVVTVGYADVSSLFSGTIQNNGGGTLSLTKIGLGALTLTGTNTFGGLSGFTTVIGGQIVVANPLALSGPSVATSNVVGGIVFSNITSATFGGLGVLGNAGTSVAGIGLTNTAGQAVTLTVGSNRGTFTTYSGQLSGGGTFVLNFPTYTLRVGATNAAYTGDTLIDAGTLDVNFGGWFPSGPGVGNLFVGSNAVVGLRTVNSNGTYNVNGLSGSGIIEGFNGAGTKNIVVGNNNATSLFSGSILNTDPAAANGPLGITKVGTGTFTLTGTNIYTSPTTVNAGVLAIAGDGSISNSASITVTTGGLLDFSGHTGGGATLGGGVTNQILRGFGSIKGNLTLGSLASLAPGTNAAPGFLTFSNNLVITSGVSLSFHAGAATDLAAVGGNLTLDGTLDVLDGGGITNLTYTLFTYGGTLTTNGSPTILTIGNLPNSNFTYAISITTPHQVNLVVGCPTCTSADPFAAWQSHYFPADGPNAAGGADPDHDGVSNTNEFLAGFNPTNAAAYPHIISITKTNGTDINVIYLGANGDNTWSPGIASRTNVLEVTTGTANGSYTNNFVSTGQTNILSGGSGFGIVTNMIDSGGATNRPSRYYRVRVLAP